MQPKLVVFSLAMIALLTLSALGQESGGDYSEPEMLRIQGGTFRMKGDQPKDVDHTVGVSGFKMGKYEVSNQEYKKFKPGHTGAWSKLDNPVESVTWDDAQAYCRWLSEKTGKSYRLPTEAEWEYACRAGSTTDYYWGENSNGKASGNPNINDFAWCDANSGEAAHPVGQKKPNDWGLYDMSGNVIEWCSDWYSGNYYGESPKNDPQGPLDGTERVLRGSEFRESGESCQSGWRFQTPPNTRDKGLGFRLVLDEMPRVGTPSEVGTSLEVGAPVTVNRGGAEGILAHVTKVTEEFAAVAGYSHPGEDWYRKSAYKKQANQWTVDRMSPKLSKEPLRLPPNTRVGALIFMVPSKNYRLSFGQGRDGIAYKSFCGTVQSADETGATLEFLGMTRKIDKSKFFYKDRSLSLQIKLTDFLDPTYEPTGVESLKPGDIIAVYNTYSYEIVQVRAVRAHPYRPGTLIDIDKHYFDKANVYTVPGFPYPIVRKRHFLH